MSPTSYQAAPPRDTKTYQRINACADPASPSGQQLGGDDRDRTGDLLLAKQALSQLSYAPLGLPGIALERGGASWTRTRDLSLIRTAL